MNRYPDYIDPGFAVFIVILAWGAYLALRWWEQRDVARFEVEEAAVLETQDSEVRS